jgi:hypothetical protein
MTRITNFLLLGLLTKPPDHRGGLAVTGERPDYLAR